MILMVEANQDAHQVARWLNKIYIEPFGVRYALVAQQVVHLHGKQEVGCSSHLVGTIIILGFSEQILRQNQRNNV